MSSNGAPSPPARAIPSSVSRARFLHGSAAPSAPRFLPAAGAGQETRAVAHMRRCCVSRPLIRPCEPRYMVGDSGGGRGRRHWMRGCDNAGTSTTSTVTRRSSASTSTSTSAPRSTASSRTRTPVRDRGDARARVGGLWWQRGGERDCRARRRRARIPPPLATYLLRGLSRPRFASHRLHLARANLSSHRRPRRRHPPPGSRLRGARRQVHGDG